MNFSWLSAPRSWTNAVLWRLKILSSLSSNVISTIHGHLSGNSTRLAGRAIPSILFSWQGLRPKYNTTERGLSFWSIELCAAKKPKWTPFYFSWRARLHFVVIDYNYDIVISNFVFLIRFQVVVIIGLPMISISSFWMMASAHLTLHIKSRISVFGPEGNSYAELIIGTRHVAYFPLLVFCSLRWYVF